MNFLEITTIILGILLVVAVIYYAKDIFIKTPLQIIEVSLDRLLTLITILTLPILLPLLYLSYKYDWRLEESAVFRFFNRKNRFGIGQDDYDLEYDSEELLEIDDSDTEYYLISTNLNLQKVEETIINGITLNPTSILSCTHVPSGFKNRSVFRLTNATLYDFHFLIQWLHEKLKRSKNYGIAVSKEFKFYSYPDSKSLNNLLGKTDEGKKFSYSLTGNNPNALSINSRLDIMEIEDFEQLNHKSVFSNG